MLPTDHVLGKADAPNIIIDYFSLTCPHCANFHAAVLPVVKRDWIDTGRLRFIYRHFPSDAVATRGSLLAECGGREVLRDDRCAVQVAGRLADGAARRKTRW